MTTITELEARIAALETLATPAPLVTTPPITIGSLTDVPAPGSPIAAQWAQNVSGMVVHRFTNLATIGGWAAPNGARAVAVDTGVEYRRIGGAWSQITPWIGSNVGTALAGSPTVPVGTVYINTVNVPADAGPRVISGSCLVRFDKWPAAPPVTVAIVVAGTAVVQYEMQTETVDISTPAFRRHNVAMSFGGVLAPAAAVTVVQVRVTTTANYNTVGTTADITVNRLDATATPRGY